MSETTSSSQRPQASVQDKPAEPRADRLPPYRVLLHNDDATPMDWVVETLILLTPHTVRAAMRIMLQAHNSGSALVLVTHRERAELYQEQFTSRLLNVTIEPAE